VQFRADMLLAINTKGQTLIICRAREGWFWWGSTHLGMSALRNRGKKRERPRYGYGPIHSRSHCGSGGEKRRRPKPGARL